MEQTKNKTPENCPLCGEKNHCANLSVSKSCEDCWCMKDDVAFPQSLLSNAAGVDKNKACICKSCALKYSSVEK